MMPATKALVKEAELTRYLKAHSKAGIAVIRTEITQDGKVVIITQADPSSSVDSEWDEP